MSLKYALFLGCVVPNRYPGIEVASRKVMPKIGVMLEDLTGASCCPAPGVIGSLSRDSWLALASRNLCLAERLGLNVLTVCNGCFATLSDANRELKESSERRDRVTKLLHGIGLNYVGRVKVRHIAEVLGREVGSKAIQEHVTKPLSGLKVAVHYGCHLVKPRVSRNFDNPENPTILDELVKALGAESVDYEEKMACCGAGGGVRSGVPDVSLRMLNEKLANIQNAGADCVVDVCPFCHLQFDKGQVELKQGYDISYSIPVLHYVQALGLAMGYSVAELGLDQQFTWNQAIAKKLGGGNGTK